MLQKTKRYRLLVWIGCQTAGYLRKFGNTSQLDKKYRKTYEALVEVGEPEPGWLVVPLGPEQVIRLVPGRRGREDEYK